jgi:peptide/nickel transport system substrate-binding protein
MVRRCLHLFAALTLAFAFTVASAQDLDAPQGGVVQIPLATTPGSLNPILPSELASAIINWTMFSPLTAVNPWTNEVEPYLAESYDANDDLTVWTFYLHQGVTWHDGEPFTAEDVKFTFDAIRDPETAATTAPDFARVTDVEVVDDHTVRVTLSASDGFFADRLSLGGNEIIPKHVLEGFDSLYDAVDFISRNPIGTGPFKMRNAQPGSFYELVANEDFFRGRPFLDGLTFRVVPDGNTRVTQLLTRQLDWVDLEAPQLPSVRNNPNIQVTTFDSLGYQLFAWNLRNPLFQDERVRIAMTHAVDRRSMAQTVSPNLGYVDDVYIPAGVEWVERPDVEFREYDPELALQILAEAGWERNAAGLLEKDGETFSFYILVDRGDVQREQMGLILQQYFTDIGMDVEYVLAERGGRWLEETQARTFDTRLAAFPLPNLDWAQRLYTCNGPFNSQSYCNEEVDRLFGEVLSTIDRQEQSRALTEVGYVLYDDPPNMVLLWRDRMTAHSADVGNIPPNNIKDSMPFSYLLYRR